MNDNDWISLKSLTDALEAKRLLALTFVINHHSKGVRYCVAVIVDVDGKKKQIEGIGESTTEALNELSKKWGEL